MVYRPRYLQIVDDIRGKIESSEFEVGGLLPSEGQLRERYAVSRHTVREALRRLKDEGLVETRQGAASRVKRSSRPVYTYSVSSVAELLQYATDAKYEIDKSSVVVADGALGEKFECAIGSRWLRVEGFRFLKESHAPLCWTEVFVHSECHRRQAGRFHRQPETGETWLQVNRFGRTGLRQL